MIRSVKVDLPRGRSQEIQELAEAVTEEYFPGQRIEPVEVLKRKSITHNFGHYGDAFDGMLECEGGAFHVYCNLDRVEWHGSPRARFTLAHELGHYFIDEHRNALAAGRVPAHPSKCEFESELLVEREADLFASAFLMPPGRFAKTARNAAPGLEGILRLKDHFGTSVTSTAIRYAKLDLLPCVVIKWHTDSFAWYWISDSLYARGFGRTLDQIDHVPPDSATGEALQDVPAASGFHERGGTASFWFKHRRRGAGDPIMMEQAVSLGRFGALTLLYPLNEV